MRTLGVIRMPAWLLTKLGHYPSINDYDVASVEDCTYYLKHQSQEAMQEQAMSSSFYQLSLKAIPFSQYKIKPGLHNLTSDCANSSSTVLKDNPMAATGASEMGTSMTVDQGQI
jgi:hypothetical protein